MFKHKHCQSCDKEVMSSGAYVALYYVAGILAALVAFKLILRRHAAWMMPILHRVRKQVDRYRRRRKERRQRRRNRRKRRRCRRGDEDEDEQEDMGENTSAFEALAVYFRTAAAHVVHDAIKTAKSSSLFGASESVRILLNVCKIVTHLYGGSLVYCVTWPQSMVNFPLRKKRELTPSTSRSSRSSPTRCSIES